MRSESRRGLACVFIVAGLAFFAACEGSFKSRIPGVGGPVPLTGTVAITGTAQVGQTLAADTSNLGGSGEIAFQWKRGDVGVGANGGTYIVQPSDVGYAITVTVTRAGNPGSVTSEPTAEVIASVGPQPCPGIGNCCDNRDCEKPGCDCPVGPQPCPDTGTCCDNRDCEKPGCNCPVTPGGVTINPPTAMVIRGGTPQQFAATVTPAGAPQDVDWSVYPSPDGVSISPTGLLTVGGTSVSNGATLTVTASVPDTALVSNPATVTVVVMPTGVTMTSYASTVIRGGEPRQFAAVVEPQGAPQNLVWVVDPQPAGVSINAQTGLLTVGPGVTPGVSFAVRATHAALFDYAIVTVIAPDPESVAVNPQHAGVLRGATQQFAATVAGPAGVLGEVTWHVYPATDGTITGQGLLTLAANATGELTVKARATSRPAVFGYATVTVLMEEGFTLDFSGIRNEARDVEYAAPDISYIDLLDGSAMVINVTGTSDLEIENFAWFFGGAPITNANAGVAISNNGRTLALGYSILNRIGRHRVTLEVEVDGARFSRVIIFYVVP